MNRIPIQSESQGIGHRRTNSPGSPRFRREDESSPDFYNPEKGRNGFSRHIESHPSTQSELRHNEQTSRKQSQISHENESAAVIIQISLGALGQREIKCNLDDDPETLAFEFCNEHGLAREAVPVIVDMIHKQFTKLFKKQQKRSAPKKTDPEIFTFSPKGDESNQVANNLKPPAEQLSHRNSKADVNNSGQYQEEVEQNPPSTQKKSSIASIKNKLVVKFDIDINPQEKRELRLYRDQDPHEVAAQFCYENNLPEPVIGVLAEKLQDALNMYEAKRARKRTLQTEENETQAPFIQRTPKNASTGTFKGLTEPDQEPESEGGNSAAAKYEKWQSLIKEKERKQQEQTAQFNTEDPRGRKKSEDLYQVAMSSMHQKNVEKSPRHIDKSFTGSQMSSRSRSPLSRKHSKNKLLPHEVEDLTNRLYNSRRATEAKLEKIREEEAKRKQEEESKELTHQPNIHKYDRSKSSEPLTRRYMNIEAELQKRKRLEQEKLLQLAEECPFKPTLNETTLQLTRSRSKSPIHERLYYEGMAHEKHMQKWRDMAFNDIYPFKPTLPHDIENFIQKRPKLNQEDFIRRLIQEKHDKELRLLKRRMEENNGRDPKTGRPLFHPYVPHDQYYWRIKEKDDEKSEIYLDVETMQVKRRDLSQIRPTITTIKHIGGLKYIFDKLDSDKDNYISTAKMDPSRVELPILEALCDFFSWLDEHQATVDFAGFCVAIERLCLQEKIHQAFEALREENPTYSNELLIKCYESVRFPRPNRDDIVFPNPNNESVYDPEKSKGTKSPSNKSPSNKTNSTRTLNYSKDSTKLTKHYAEILSRKKSERSF